jgi:hypothetical protein
LFDTFDINVVYDFLALGK